MFLDRPVGIDLGTTNSAVALLEPDGRELMILTDRLKRRIIPSVVGWDPGAQDFLVGYPAWNRRGMSPEPVCSVKRKMGQTATVAVGPRALTPEEVSAKILDTLRRGMLDYAGARLEGYELGLARAVITVPAYFDAPQIEATRKAGELAGLKVLGLLQEPTAAAIFHAWKHDLGDGLFFVYDLGGGTFDVSVIRRLMGEYQVLAIHGDNFLGGDDFDRRFAEHLRLHLVAQGYELALDLNDPSDVTRFTLLTRIAREVKEALSTSDFQYIARRDLFTDHAGESVNLELEVSRAQWEELMRSYVQQTLDCCKEALQLAQQAGGVALQDIDHVLLVGGSTRVPLVQQAVTEFFCGPGKSKAAAPRQDEPDTCVALGAAIHAANLGGLTLGDHARGLAVNLTSPLATRRPKARLAGRVEGARASEVVGVALADSLDPQHTTPRAEAEVVGGAFQLVDLDLPDPGVYPMSLSLVGAGGEALLTLPMAMYRGGDARQGGSALSNPTVLAKDMYLEVVRAGKVERQLLLEKGVNLPVEAQFRFYTADQSGMVLLKLLQGWRLIRTLHLDVPKELPLRSPVELRLKVDDTMLMSAEGEVGGQAFWARIEAPPARDDRSWGEVEQLLADSEQIGRALWGYEAESFRERAQGLRAGIREASATDPDKLQVLVGRLEDLMRDFRSGDKQLTPSYDRFERILNSVRRNVFQDELRKPLGLAFDAWERRLAELEAKGADAYQKMDQTAWGRAYSQAQALYESLIQDTLSYTDPTSPEGLLQNLLSFQARVRRLREEVASFVLSDNEETRKVQQDERAALLEGLDREAAGVEGLDLSKGAEARVRLERAHGAVQRLEQRFERLPSLGLVSG